MYVNIFLSDRNLQVRNNRRNSVLPLPIHMVFQVLNMHGILYFRIRNYQNCCLMMNCCFLCYWNCLNSELLFPLLLLELFESIGAARIAIRCCTILRCCLKLFLSFLFCFLLTLFLFFRRLLCRFLNL